VSGSAVTLANGVYISIRQRECLYIDWWITHPLCEWYIDKTQLVREWICFVYSWETRTRFYPSKRNSSANGSMGVTLYFCVSCFFSAFINCVYSWETKTRVCPFKRVLVVPMRPSTKQIYICVSDLFSAFISHIPNTNEVWPIYIQVKTHVRTSHVPNMIESCSTYGQVVYLHETPRRFRKEDLEIFGSCWYVRIDSCGVQSIPLRYFQRIFCTDYLFFNSSWSGAWST